MVGKDVLLLQIEEFHRIERDRRCYVIDATWFRCNDTVPLDNIIGRKITLPKSGFSFFSRF